MSDSLSSPLVQRVRQPRSLSETGGSTPMNPNKVLWEKGDFTRIAESMRESGEALVRDLESQKGSGFWISDAAMERRHYQRRDLEQMCWASISRGTLLRLGTSVPRGRASRTASFRKAMRPICTS